MHELHELIYEKASKNYTYNVYHFMILDAFFITICVANTYTSCTLTSLVSTLVVFKHFLYIPHFAIFIAQVNDL